jgi:hypothetical protein
MSAVDLYGELAIARGGLCADDPERQWLRRRGVRCPLLGWSRVGLNEFHYEPGASDARVFIFPVLDGPHECFGGCVPPKSAAGRNRTLIDLAAWRPSEPEVTRLRCGNVPALGYWTIEAPFMDDLFALHLYSTPIAWHVAGCEGAVIIDWRAAAVELLNFEKIVCDTLGLGEKLERELKLARRRISPRLPEILVSAIDQPEPADV